MPFIVTLKGLEKKLQWLSVECVMYEMQAGRILDFKVEM